MFVGHVSRSGSASTVVFLPLITFMTMLLTFMEIQGVKPLWLAVAHSLCGWPTITETLVLSFLIWSCRVVKRIIGAKQLRNLVGYSFGVYLPVYLYCMIKLRWYENIALLYFYPYSLFVFVFAHVPEYPVYLALTDKLFVTFAFSLTVAVHFPYTLVPLCTAIIGNVMWSYDIFHLARWAEEPMITEDGGPPAALLDELVQETPEHTARRRRGPVDDLIDMGFTEHEAIEALTRSGNNMQGALECLLAD